MPRVYEPNERALRRMPNPRSAYALPVIDTHCHLTFHDFEGRLDAEMAEAAEAGVTGALTISTTTTDCLDALAAARAYKRVWCSAGVHPLHADAVEAPEDPASWANIRLVGQDPKCVAWGELGLDNHYDHPPTEVQRRVLEHQLERLEAWTAEGLAKPIVVHCRKAFDDLIPVLRASTLPNDRFVFHCFTGGPDDVRQCLDLGAMVSFTGVVTYRNAKEVQEAAAIVPDDRIMVETDAPFLSPEPMRGKRPCRPAYVAHTARRLAELRETPFETFHEVINENTARFFGVR